MLVTSDLIGFPADFTEPACRRISENTGLRREQILLNSSHTHTGPTLGLEESELNFPPDQAQATIRYTRWLQDRLVEVVGKSMERLEPANLSWGTGVATFVMNRREFTDRGVQLGVNPAVSPTVACPFCESTLRTAVCGVCYSVRPATTRRSRRRIRRSAAILPVMRRLNWRPVTRVSRRCFCRAAQAMRILSRGVAKKLRESTAKRSPTR